MRKCTRQIVNAFINGKPLKTKNMHCDGGSIRLHGNLIAWRHDDAIYVTLAGWGSVITRERLNGLCRVLDGRRPFSQKNHVQHYMGLPIGERDIIRIR